VVLAKNHESQFGKCENELQNVDLKRPIKIFPSPSTMIVVFSTCEKNLGFQFFDLNIENSLGRGTLAKIELPL
jgi:hypothetical protein